MTAEREKSPKKRTKAFDVNTAKLVDVFLTGGGVRTTRSAATEGGDQSGKATTRGPRANLFGAPPISKKGSGETETLGREKEPPAGN